MAAAATVGTSSTTSVDPVAAIARICRGRRLWLHVDAAHVGPAAIVPELRWLLGGAEAADSLVVDLERWTAHRPSVDIRGVYPDSFVIVAEHPLPKRG